jgi:hypothetical protein
VLKQQIERLEANERKLKNLLIEREQQYESEMIDLKRMLNQERRKDTKLSTSSMLKESDSFASYG